MTEAFAKECAPLGIRVNTLLPGLTNMRFSAALFATLSLHEQMMSRIFMGRHTEPGEMAGAILYLVSDAASYTNGECLVVDGGLAL